MYITPCPQCGRALKIEECVSVKKYKNGIRRRLCLCPNYYNVIPSNGYNTFMFEYEGEGDDNAVYKLWNKAIARYISNENQSGIIEIIQIGEKNKNEK